MKNGDRPASPVQAEDYSHYETYGLGGLTKREEIAKTAMLGIISNAPLYEEICKTCVTMSGTTHAVGVARMAVNHADALLAELEDTT